MDLMRYFPFAAPIAAAVLGTLCKFRLMPSLAGDTMRQGGEIRPTAPFAELLANLFYAFAVLALLLALYQVFIVQKKKSA
jgi:hypothetical protein